MGEMDKGARIADFLKMCTTYGVQAISSRQLSKLGFFTGPASTKHHGAYEGGNFDHSYAVAKFLIEMTEAGKIVWQNPRSPWVVGIFHDICKCDSYTQVKDEPKWEYNADTVLSGHGEKSVMILSQFLQLTEEEVLCIRYHMGAYNKEDWEGINRAIAKYPSVLWTHTADMYASRVLGI